jgi:hypothetical protein
VRADPVWSRDPGLGADHRERVGVALLRHQRAGAAVAVGELDGGELLARQDLEVLPELRPVGGGGGGGGRELDVAVPLPHRVLRVDHQAVAAEELRQPLAADRPARPGAAPDPRDAPVEPRVDPPQAPGVAQGRLGVGEEQVPDGGRLRGLEVRVVGGEVVRVALRERDEGLGQVELGVVEVEHARARDQPQRHPERLPPRAAGAEPPGRRCPDARLQLRLARVERVAELGVPGELRRRDGVEREQPPEEAPGVVAADGAALHERHGMCEVGPREPARQPRAMRHLVRVARAHQLRCGTAGQAPAGPQVLVRHATEVTDGADAG